MHPEANERNKYDLKSITPVDDYECTLSPNLVEILARELRETEGSRAHGIQALRDWTMQNPRIIKTRLDSSWLLKHLRFKKYNIPAAQEAIERHLVLRQGVYGSTYFHTASDVLQPSVKKIFDVNSVCLLPNRDKGGRPIILFRYKNVEPDSSSCLLKDVYTAQKNLFESLGEIEEFLIRGIVLILDVSGLGAAYLKVLPVEHVLKILKNAEKCVAIRLKGVHVVNVPYGFSYIINLALQHAPLKIRERIKVYKNFDEFDLVDKKDMPEEYGGTVPMKELMVPLWEMLMKDRDVHLAYTKMLVDEKMYPRNVFEGSIEMLKIPLNSDDLFEKAKNCSNDALYGVQGSFRKLEID